MTLSRQSLIYLCFNVKPQPQHLSVSEGQDLASDDATNSLFPVTPPPTIRQARPKSSSLGSSGRSPVRYHERQAPALRPSTG
jgi:hypothetical protein